MGRHFNRLFRVDTAGGERLAIRVCLPDGRTDAKLDAELAWLAALAQDTALTIPVARFSTRVAAAGLPAGARCIGFTWVKGRPCAAAGPDAGARADAAGLDRGTADVRLPAAARPPARGRRPDGARGCPAG